MQRVLHHLPEQGIPGRSHHVRTNRVLGYRAAARRAVAICGLGIGAGFGCGSGTPSVDAPRPESSAPQPESTSEAVVADPPSVGDHGTAVVIWLRDGEYAKVRAMFGEEMAKAVPDDQALEAMWSGLEAKLGKLQKQLAVKVVEKGDIRAALVTWQFEALPMDVHIAFDKNDKIVGLFVRPASAVGPRPQTPKPPFPYEQREVLYDNPSDGSKIGGTLTMPEGAGPYPAVLLITGSGSQDRDETIFGHKPFFVIADHLTRKGVAVLRVDDRGIGTSTGVAKDATIETHATDVEAGLAFLKVQKGIDPKRIGLIGHSEGGIIAPLVASRSKDVAFIVSLAGTGLPGTDINPMQIEALLRASGEMSEEGIVAIAAAQRKLMKLAADGASDDALKAALTEAMDAAVKHAGEGADAKANIEKAQMAMVEQVKTIQTPWYLSFLKLDPRTYWAKVKVPVIVMIGDKDLQVPADPNIAGVREALTRARNKHARFEKLPGLNHLFQQATTGLVGEYATIKQTFDPGALEMMSAWITATTSL